MRFCVAHELLIRGRLVLAGAAQTDPLALPLHDLLAAGLTLAVEAGAVDTITADSDV